MLMDGFLLPQVRDAEHWGCRREPKRCHRNFLRTARARSPGRSAPAPPGSSTGPPVGARLSGDHSRDSRGLTMAYQVTCPTCGKQL
jgi:hypothetical protein